MAGTDLVLHPIFNRRGGRSEYAARYVPNGRMGRLWANVRSVPQGVHHLIGDTFTGRSGTQAAVRTTVKTVGGYGAAAASGGFGAWLAHKFLPKSLQGGARKAAVATVGVGSAFLPSLIRRFVFKR